MSCGVTGEIVTTRVQARRNSACMKSDVPFGMRSPLLRFIVLHAALPALTTNSQRQRLVRRGGLGGGLTMRLQQRPSRAIVFAEASVDVRQAGLLVGEVEVGELDPRSEGGFGSY